MITVSVYGEKVKGEENDKCKRSIRVYRRNVLKTWSDIRRADCRTVYETDSERKTLDGAMSFSSRYKTRVLYCNTG